MKKIILIFLFLNTTLFADSNNSYSIILYKTFSIDKAQQYADKIKNPKKKIFLVKGKYNYLIAYGKFNSYNEAEKYLIRYRSSIYSHNPIIYEFDLSQSNKFNKKNNSDFSIKLIGAQTSLSSDLKYGSLGTKIDLENDLGVNKAVNNLIPEIAYKKDSHLFYVNYLTSVHNGSSIINKDIIADNYTYNLGSLLTTSIESSIFNIGYKYNIFGTNFGVLFNNYNKELSLKDLSNATDIKLEYTLHGLTLDKQHSLDKYIIEYGVKFGQGNYVSLQNYFLSIGIKNLLINNSSISLGYGSTKYKIDDSTYQEESNYNTIYIVFSKGF